MDVCLQGRPRLQAAAHHGLQGLEPWKGEAHVLPAGARAPARRIGGGRRAQEAGGARREESCVTPTQAAEVLPEGSSGGRKREGKGFSGAHRPQPTAA